MLGQLNFFDYRKEQSRIKTEIVEEYFRAWAAIITLHTHTDRVGYADLFSGPGRYKDGTPSTPLAILKTAVEHKTLPRMLVSMFNDAKREYAEQLQQEIDEMPNIGILKHRPVVLNESVGRAFEEFFGQKRLIPTFLFLDPWGVKGLTRRLMLAVLKDWGSDCVFFFNFALLRRAIFNPLILEHAEALFGIDRIRMLQEELPGKDSFEQEEIMLSALRQAFEEETKSYMLSFRFYDDKAVLKRHLMSLSRDKTGYKIMKEIMGKHSTSHEQGVPTYEYHPVDASSVRLFTVSQPLDMLLRELPERMARRTLSVEEVFFVDSYGTPYLFKNYQEVLKQLEGSGRVSINPPASERKPNTLNRQAIVTFR